MRFNRTQNAKRNIIFGWVQNLYNIIVPFFTRTVFIYVMGVQYLGLNSLFSSLLSVLNLAELGVGFALTFSMYKPIAEDNHQKVCALMRLYKIYYRLIGLVVAVIGCCLVPFLHVLIKDEVPGNLNIYVLYFINLGTTVLSYWLFAYKNCLLTAHQRNDLTTKIALFTSAATNILQIVLLLVFKNYYLYLIVSLVNQVVCNIITAILSSKLFPQYKANGSLPKDEIKSINKRVRDLFTSKLGAVVMDNADTIVISAFMGLKVLAVYQNYFFILTSIRKFITVIFTSCTAGIGNSLVVETKEKNYNDLNSFVFMINWIACFCVCCFLALYQPFMKLWVGEELMLGFDIVFLLALYFYVMEINQLLNLYKDAAGLWSKDKWRPLCSAIVNFVLNLCMVKKFGLYGILISTVIAVSVVEMPWLIYNIFHELFSLDKRRSFLFKLLKYFLCTVIVATINTTICSFVNSSVVPTMLIRLAICLLVPNGLLLLLFKKNSDFRKSMLIVQRITKIQFIKQVEEKKYEQF